MKIKKIKKDIEDLLFIDDFCNEFSLIDMYGDFKQIFSDFCEFLDKNEKFIKYKNQIIEDFNNSFIKSEINKNMKNLLENGLNFINKNF